MPRTCKVCGKASKRLSVRRLCPKCGIARMRDNIEQLRSRKGPLFEKWDVLRAEGLHTQPLYVKPKPKRARAAPKKQEREVSKRPRGKSKASSQRTEK